VISLHFISYLGSHGRLILSLILAVSELFLGGVFFFTGDAAPWKSISLFQMWGKILSGCAFRRRRKAFFL